MTISLTENIKTIFLNKYKLGGTVKGISRELKLHTSSVRRWLKRENIEIIKYSGKGIPKNTTYISPKTASIIELHKSGKSCRQIANELNTSEASVSLILNRRGFSLNIGKRLKKRKIKEDYFTNIDNHKKSYFLGLLCADGCVNLRTGKVSISLKEGDSYLLVEFLKEIESDCKLGFLQPKIKGDMQRYLQVYSTQMANDLISYGCVERKSKYLDFPKIDDEYFSSFLRGFFDGDGCVRIQKGGYKRVSFTSTELFNSKLKQYLLEKLNINSCLSLFSNKYSDLIINSKTGVEKIGKFMYQHDGVAMIRKRKILFFDFSAKYEIEFDKKYIKVA